MKNDFTYAASMIKQRCGGFRHSEISTISCTGADGIKGITAFSENVFKVLRLYVLNLHVSFAMNAEPIELISFV